MPPYLPDEPMAVRMMDNPASGVIKMEGGWTADLKAVDETALVAPAAIGDTATASTTSAAPTTSRLRVATATPPGVIARVWPELQAPGQVGGEGPQRELRGGHGQARSR